jgi:hypothetical protein
MKMNSSLTDQGKGNPTFALKRHHASADNDGKGFQGLPSIIRKKAAKDGRSKNPARTESLPFDCKWHDGC